MAYAYISFGQLKTALLERLQDQYLNYTTSTGSGFVSPDEAGLYLTEALQTLNAFCPKWNADMLLSFDYGDTWRSLNISGSPRERTITDTNLYTLMEYHLLEPPTGGIWTGTTQFNIVNMLEALNFRRNELMQVSGANTFSLTVPAPTAGVRTTLPDNVLDLRRVRWVPSAGRIASPLCREDQLTFNAYGAQNNLIVADPESYSVTSNQPLDFDCSTQPPVPGNWDILALCAPANTLLPPVDTIMELPNDWCWVPKWGALADMLSNSPEGADRLRADYCTKRYDHGKAMMLALPWLLNAYVNGVPTDTPSFEEADAYSQNWELNGNPWDPQIVVGGMDIVALSPSADVIGYGGGGYGGGGYGGGTLPVSVRLVVVGNAPIPTLDSDLIQLSRDGVEAIVAYAQHLATFKNGGLTFAETMPLFDQFQKYCASENSRYVALGIMRDTLINEGGRDQDIDPRYAPQQKEAASAK